MTALLEARVCNTRLTAKTGRPPELAERGLDTWRFLRKFDSDRELRHAERAASDRSLRGGLCAGNWGLVQGRLWVEGHPSPDGLASPQDLGRCLDRTLGELSDLGVPTGQAHGFSRLDFTATLRFGDGRDGQALLTACAHLDVPRTKPEVIGRPAETVYLLAPLSGRKLARIYDKGLESGTAPRGTLIRFEDQRRFKGQTLISEVHVRDHAAAMSRAFFTTRFAPVASSSEGVTIATADVLADRVDALMEDGSVSPARGCRLLGFLLKGDRHVPDRTARRWRAELRELGLILADPMGDDLEVDVAGSVEAALAAWGTDEAA